MDTGELLTRWTIRLALALYVLVLALRIRAAGRRRWLNVSRLSWTAGCLIFWLHMACAFQFYHHWSHAAAYEATAQDTARTIGLDWGGGLYANYAFALLWTTDVCWWWRAREGYLTRPRALEWAVQGFLGFIAFNATVVFGEGAVRWFGLGACLFLAALLGDMMYRRSGMVS